jgi:uncharacterized protein
LILGLLALYQSDPDLRWYRWAVRLTEDMLTYFKDPSGGFFDTRSDHEALFTRPKDLQDNATPSGNAMACSALLQMAAYAGRGEWRDIAEGSLRSVISAAVRYPTAFARWLCALDFAVGPVVEVAILGDAQDAHTQALVETLWSSYRARLVAAISAHPSPAEAPPLLDDRHLLHNQPSAYVCQNFVCRQPVNDPDELAAQLG